MFSLHFHFFIQDGNPVSFLKDILPILVSSAALTVSTITPYLLIRYEKIYSINREHKEFLRQIEIYLLEWLNVTTHNTQVNAEFLQVLETPGAVFPKKFQSYDFPTMDFFKSYNVDLVNAFYVQTRNLKDFNHHLHMIDNEYTTFKGALMNGGTLAANAVIFFQSALENLSEQYPKAVEEMVDLRIRVRLLLKQANVTDMLQPNKFFSFGTQGRFWYKKDIGFTLQEIENEKTVLRAEQDSEQRESKEANNT